MADGTSTTADGTSTTADGTSTTADGTSTTADGTSTTADGTLATGDENVANASITGGTSVQAQRVGRRKAMLRVRAAWKVVQQANWKGRWAVTEELMTGAWRVNSGGELDGVLVPRNVWVSACWLYDVPFALCDAHAIALGNVSWATL
ncbi:hypothetical protein HWV62_5022 [Athelia sp. TMB]|nr:hypothetical protein HWV62_5022 [Athelia sp. TMB]